jgi:hypothetical protein
MVQHGTSSHSPAENAPEGKLPASTLGQNIADVGDTAGGVHITVPLASSMNRTSGGAETVLKAA